MKKQEIIREFLGKGYQLDPSSLDFFLKNSGKIGPFLEMMNQAKTKPPIITLDFINSLFERPLRKPEIEVLRNFEQRKKTSVVDLTRLFVDRYEKIREFFSGRANLVNLISINKISPRTKKFSLIGMVKEKDGKNLVLEDLTGEITIFLSEDRKIVLDEVIGVICEQDDAIRAKDVIFPDIPLRRKIDKAKEDASCLFVSDIHMDERNFKENSYGRFLEWLNKKKFGKLYIFVLGDVSSNKEDIENFFDSLPKEAFKIFLKGEKDPELSVGDLQFSEFALIKIEKNIVSLLSHGDYLEKYSGLWKDPPEKIMLNLLRKRHIDPIFERRVYEEDPFILDIIPDIFVSGHFHSPGLLNYKGTTILSTGSFLTKPIFWLTNLKTRENIKLDFT